MAQELQGQAKGNLKLLIRLLKKAIKKSMFLKLVYANDPDPIAELEKMRK